MQAEVLDVRKEAGVSIEPARWLRRIKVNSAARGWLATLGHTSVKVTDGQLEGTIRAVLTWIYTQTLSLTTVLPSYTNKNRDHRCQESYSSRRPWHAWCHVLLWEAGRLWTRGGANSSSLMLKWSQSRSQSTNPWPSKHQHKHALSAGVAQLLHLTRGGCCTLQYCIQHVVIYISTILQRY